MISIAMATYNGAKYIKEQLDSILNQSVADFELVICDDVSTDNTWNILENYKNKDSRIRIYKNEKNLGFIKNFEQTIHRCNGEMIALCDQDDIWLPNHIQVLLDLIGNKMIACANAEIINGEGDHLGYTEAWLDALDSLADDDVKKGYSVFLFRSPFYGNSMLIKREFFDIALPIPQAAAAHDMWFSLLGCVYGGINYTWDCVVEYRRHNYNVSSSKTKRISRVRPFVSQIIRKQHHVHRLELINEIERRIVDRGCEYQTYCFLNEVKHYFLRRKHLWGRLYNAFFQLMHFKIVYNC